MFGHIREDLLPDVVEESRNRSSALAVPEFLLLAHGRQLCERGHCTCAKGDACAKGGKFRWGRNGGGPSHIGTPLKHRTTLGHRSTLSAETSCMPHRPRMPPLANAPRHSTDWSFAFARYPLTSNPACPRLPTPDVAGFRLFERNYRTIAMSPDLAMTPERR